MSSKSQNILNSFKSTTLPSLSLSMAMRGDDFASDLKFDSAILEKELQSFGRRKNKINFGLVPKTKGLRSEISSSQPKTNFFDRLQNSIAQKKENSKRKLERGRKFTISVVTKHKNVLGHNRSNVQKQVIDEDQLHKSRSKTQPLVSNNLRVRANGKLPSINKTGLFQNKKGKKAKSPKSSSMNNSFSQLKSKLSKAMRNGMSGIKKPSKMTLKHFDLFSEQKSLDSDQSPKAGIRRRRRLEDPFSSAHKLMEENSSKSDFGSPRFRNESQFYKDQSPTSRELMRKSRYSKTRSRKQKHRSQLDEISGFKGMAGQSNGYTMDFNWETKDKGKHFILDIILLIFEQLRSLLTKEAS